MMKLNTYNPLYIVPKQANVINFKALPESEFYKTAAAIKTEIEKANTIALFPHFNPDMDALASAVMFYELINAIGKNKQVDIYVAGTILGDLKKIMDEKYPHIKLLRTKNMPEDKTYDLAIAVDSVNSSKIDDELYKNIYEKAKSRIKVDHHKGGEDFGNINLVDDDASANTQILLKLAQKLKLPISKDFASAGYMGIATDTAFFRSFKDPVSVFEDCAELSRKGIEPDKLNQALRTIPKKFFNQYRQLLHDVNFSEDGKIGWIIENNKGERASTDKILCDIQDIEGIEVAFRVSKGKKGSGISLRKTGDVDVSKIAEKFGGGGHEYAAGCGIDGPPENAIKKVIAVTNDFLKKPQHQCPE